MKKKIMFIMNYPSRILKKISWFSIIVDSKIKKNAYIASKANIRYCNVNSYTYIGKRTNIAYTNIGKFSSIANDVSIGGGSHPIDWVSTSPVFYGSKNILKTNFSMNSFAPYKQTTIGNDVWIGSKVIIKAGLTIGDGAIIGMGSIVTKNVKPFSIVAGNPAKLLRMRFDLDSINLISNSQWWNWPESKLQKLGDYFSSPKEFINKIQDIEIKHNKLI